MNRKLAVTKVKAYAQNPEIIKEPTMGEMADLVVLVLSAIEQIETAIKEHRLDGKTPEPDKDYLSLETAQRALNEKVREMLEKTDKTLSQTSQALQERVEQAVQRIRDGKDGIVSDSEIQRAAELAHELLELPDFDALITESLTKNANAVRDGLESIVAEEDKLEIEAIGHLRKELDEIRQRVGNNISGGLTRGGVLALIAENGGGASTFLDLTDTPATYTGQALKVIQVNAGETALEFVPLAGGGDALTANPLSQFAATTSLQLKNTISDETGSGALVFANSPTLVTPALGAATATTINGATITSGTLNGSVTGTNTGDQTSIVGITGTKAQFDTAVTDGNFLYVGDAPTAHTHLLSEITDSTTEALGVGSLEVGHASDTTITRTGAGAIAVEGVAVVLAATSPTLATITTTGNLELGHATDTTISRVSPGVIAVEGVAVPTISSTSTLTNKTMTGATNTITASVLKSATTEVNIAPATAPTTGQVLTATSSTAATWQTPSASGGTQTINTEAAGSATLLVAEISNSTATILNIVESNAASQTITLPTADVGDVGKWYQIYNKGTNRMTITSASTLLGDSVILAANAGCVAYITSTGNYTLVGTGNQTQEIQMPCTDWTTNLTVGDGKYYLRIPSKFNGWEITSVHAEVITAGTTGTTDIQLHNVTDAVDILTTKITIDSTEQGSDTAVTAAVINASNKNLATEDRIRVDVDAISTTAPQGLIVSLTIQPL